jgi:beta-galactosidase
MTLPQPVATKSYPRLRRTYQLTMEFPISVWYGVQTVASPEIREARGRDFDVIRKVGFRFVRGWVNWRDAEPRQREYHLDFVRSFLETAEVNELKVILQVYLEFAPDWLPRVFPDSLYVSETDYRVVPGGSAGVCLGHPRVRAKAEEFLRRLAVEAKGYSNFYGWDLWSEPRIVKWVYYPSVSRRVYCYCESSVARFRRWVSTMYKVISELNRAWHRFFNSFEEVEPPRFVVLHYARENLDWLTFSVEKFREDLE